MVNFPGYRPSWARGWRLSVAAAGLGILIVLLRLPLQPVLKGQAAFLFAWPAILVAAFLGGFWPALITTVAGLVVGQHLLLSSGLPGLKAGAAIIYMGFGLVFAIAGGMRKRGLRQAEADAERLKAMQSQMVHVARLNAMGEMAGTVAHELNQPLAAITSYLGATRRLIERESQAGPKVLELLEKVSQQALRARDIISRIRAQVSSGEVRPLAEPLAGILNETVAVAGESARLGGVNIRLDHDRGAGLVFADRIQVQQVLLNLIRNAAEAMASSPRRELRVESHLEQDGFVRISVADTGPGISPKVMERLFEPFVTDKADGMGIGLSISRNIIESHGGKLWAESHATDGAIFHFTLRAAAAADAVGEPPASDAAS